MVLLTDAYGGHGGIAKFNRDLLLSLSSYPGCEIVYAIPRLGNKKMENYPDKVWYEKSGLGGKINYLKSVLRTAFFEKNFDIIICAHINLLPVAYVARLIMRCPLVLIGHGIDIWQPTKSLLTDWCSTKIDAFVAVSDLTRKRFISWSKMNISSTYVLPNSIDNALFFPGEKNKALLERYQLVGKNVLLTFGRLAGRNREKGFDEVLEVLPALVEKNSNIVYLIAGSGCDLDRLKKKAVELGVISNVRFIGHVSEKEKVETFRLADVYVMPSRGEGFGIVLLEAMACGVPVIASKADGSREAVMNGRLGLMVDPSNFQEIKEAILEAFSKAKEVPENLGYFSFNNFILRTHFIVSMVTK